MKYRKIGSSALSVSEIGLGCMSIGTNELHAIHIIDQALDLGINYLDTADLYDQGLNEEFVGKALKGKRQDIILATKVGNKFEVGKEGWSWDPSKKHIMSAVKKSLQRMQTDYIDLYQLHGGTTRDNIDETIEAFEELKQEGVIRYYGISSIRPNVIREYVNRSSIVSVMMQYSILDRRPEEVFSLLKEHNISVLARGPLAKGVLTGKKEASYMDYSAQELHDLIPLLKREINNERSLTEIALRYCLHEPVVASVVAGASKVDQVTQNCHAASSTPLTDSEVRKIREMTKGSLYKEHK